jgi:hypothetical protein
VVQGGSLENYSPAREAQVRTLYPPQHTKKVMSNFECSICHYPWSSLEEVTYCESQGTQKNELNIGDKFLLPVNGGILYEVIELLIASHGNHVPGAIAEVIEGDISSLFIGEPDRVGYFDQETVIRYLQK